MRLRGFGAVAAMTFTALALGSCGLDSQIVNTLDPPKDAINPVAVMSAPTTVGARSYVTVDGTQSYSQQNLALTYSWTLTEAPHCSSAGFGTATATATDASGNATTSCVTNSVMTSSNPAITFLADKGGYYTVTLTVSETSGASVTYTSQMVSARISAVGEGSNHPPVAVAKTPATSQNVATLDGTESYDADGQPLSYSWTVYSGSTSSAQISDSSSATAYIYNWVDTSQSYTIKLHVSDGMDYDEAFLTVTVGAAATVTM